MRSAQVKMSDALAVVEASNGPAIEAKYEIDDSGKLALSIYPLGASLEMDAERNVFQEVSGDPTVVPFKPAAPEKFSDAEHLKRSSRDLTLVQLGTKKLPDVVAAAEADGSVFWAIPTIKATRAGYGVYALGLDGSTSYRFVDGGGSSESGVQDLGTGPGSGATDSRAPELEDLSVLSAAKVSMADGLKTAGPAIEAKFEMGDDGKLSLSIYPVGDAKLDPERTEFKELAGDPTVSPWAPSASSFEDTDVEHLTRSSRDLTLVQTSGMTLAQAVDAAQAKIPNGFVYWAIPTIRGTRAGYGIYIYEAGSAATHYFFVS
jgi:hypothetical protein